MKTQGQESTGDSSRPSDRAKARPGFFKKLLMRRKKQKCVWRQSGFMRISEELELEKSQQHQLRLLLKDLNSIKNVTITSRKSGTDALLEAMQSDRFDSDIAHAGGTQILQGLQLQLTASLDEFGTWFNQLNQLQKSQLRMLLKSQFSEASHC